jgi:protease IV
MASDQNRPGRGAVVRRWAARTLLSLGLLTLLGTLVLLLVALIARETVPRQTILELDLERDLVEWLPQDPVAHALHGRKPAVRDVVDALHRGAEDDRVLALVARVGSGALGFGQVEEIRDAVTAFRASGKPAVLFSETFGEVGPGNGGYYLATAFDEVYLQPSGDLGLTGLIAETPFLRGTLENLDVEPRLDQRHEYKSAMNTFTEEQYTEPHREATEEVLQTVYGSIVRAIAAARQLPDAQVRELVDRGPLLGEEAVQAGLVDRLAYRDEVFESLRTRVGADAEFLFVDRYLSRAGRPHRRGETIALIYGVGAVQRGESEFSAAFGGLAMGSETVTRAFHQAIDDPSVRAIIFRIDSPGGSYVASDAIWREVVRARAAGKPVIATMGNVAASGGYFVAMAADRIVAQPSTLTGSIGVVGGKMVTRDLWNRLGVSFDEVEVGANAGIYSVLQDFTPEEWSRMQAWLDRVYQDFVGKVAEGRQMTPEQADQVARGRVWTGLDAHRLGLVDELGGFTTALHLARDAAGITPEERVRIRVFPAERTLLQVLLDRGPSSSRPEVGTLLARGLDALQPVYALARQLGVTRPPGVLTMPPLELR